MIVRSNVGRRWGNAGNSTCAVWLKVRDFAQRGLTVLIADNNQLTTLDLSNNGDLVSVYVNNNLLRRLDVSGNADLTTLNARNNPYLACIQIDDPQMVRFGGWVKDARTVYSKDCSRLW